MPITTAGGLARHAAGAPASKGGQFAGIRRDESAAELSPSSPAAAQDLDTIFRAARFIELEQLRADLASEARRHAPNATGVLLSRPAGKRHMEAIAVYGTDGPIGGAPDYLARFVERIASTVGSPADAPSLLRRDDADAPRVWRLDFETTRSDEQIDELVASLAAASAIIDRAMGPLRRERSEGSQLG